MIYQDESLQREKNIKINIYICILALFMFAVMFVPTTYSGIRFILFIALLLVAILSCGGKISPERGALYVFITYILYGIVSFAVGLFNKAPGAIPSLKTSIFWPLIYVLVGSFIAKKKYALKLSKLMLLFEFVVCIYDLWYCISCITPIPFPSLLLKINLDLSFNKFGIVYRFTTLHMVTHIFMIPFTMALYFGDTIFSKKRLTILVALELMVLLFAGRVALQLGVIAVSFLMYFITPRKRKLSNISSFFKGIGLIVLLVLLAYIIMKAIGFKIDNYIENITSKLQESFSDSSNDQTRQAQSSALLNGWLQSPIFGHGLGSYAHESIRDYENEWAYEMTYHAMLFQQGILGVITFFSLNIYSIRRIIKLYRAGILQLENSYPWIAGLISILIASSVDPYFGKMGCLWMLFFPFAIAAFNREGDLTV